MINALSSGVLPNSGMTINVPSLVTSAGGQSGVAPVVTVEAEAGAVENTGMVTEYLTGTVKKYSGMNTLSVELLERSDPNFYAELTNQLQRAYSLATDAAVIADVVAGGVQGTAVAATSAGIISYVSTETPNIYKNTSYFAKNYVAGPSQWSLLLGATDTTGRPIYNAQPNTQMNSAGQSVPTSIRGNVLGLDLYVDHQMVATTIDDSAFIVAPEAMTVYRSPQAYMSVNVVSNLQIQVAIYGFMATIVKMPNGLVRYNLT
jgi:HK97 family phage major capsid protein